MENYYSPAQTPLILDEHSLMLIQNNFEWSASSHFSNPNFFYESVNTPTNSADSNGLVSPNFETDLDLSGDILNFQGLGGVAMTTTDPNEKICHLNIDGTFQNIFDEIESISSFFIDDVPLSSSESALSDQQVSSPPMQAQNAEFYVQESSGDSQSSVDSSDDGCKLKGVKSGRVNKKESNKVAAVRYRAKKVKEREMLFAQCDLYEQKNLEMKGKISDIELEIGLIKNLLVEALKVK